jgi:hypothetical protein
MVRLSRVRGPLVFVWGTDEHGPEAVELSSGPGGSLATLAGHPVAGVERVLTALAGLSVHSGIEVRVEGPELPPLDAAGLELALALRALGAPRDRPRLRVVQSGEILAGRARYSFEPHPTIEVIAEVDGPTGARQRLSWDGSPATFLGRIAARPLQIGGVDQVRALHMEPERPEVADGALPSRMSDTEEARSALLRLLADLYRFGGPPLGRVFARRPDHPASQHVLRQGLEFGLLERLPPV